ncbi:hypothetical protein AB4Z45_07380 [Paenibacillus sp. MCAF9]
MSKLTGEIPVKSIFSSNSAELTGEIHVNYSSGTKYRGEETKPEKQH